MKKPSLFKIILIVGVVVLIIVLAGNTGIPPPPERNNITPAPTFAQSQDETIRVGAFNIQVFGVTKAAKQEVMDILAKIIKTYDIVAIEEIRDGTETALPMLVNSVNTGDSQYAYIVSERLGRTSSKEQYAYIYNTVTVTLTDIPETYPDLRVRTPSIGSLTSHHSGRLMVTSMRHSL
jgi:hypothetical protein